MIYKEHPQSAEDVLAVDEFMDRLMNLLRAVREDSDTYGTWHEERSLRDFLLDSGLFSAARNDGRDDAD